jgi:DNA polymerase-1
VVQASAADWALVLLAALRRRLAALPMPNEGRGVPQSANSAGTDPVGLADSAGTDPAPVGRWNPLAPHLVFFQHDEAITEAAAEAGRTVFGVTQVRFPMTTAVVSCYGDAK